MNGMFEFATSARIVFGAGTRRQAGGLARGLGRQALVVTGSRPERADFLGELLGEAGVEFSVLAVAGEPTLDAAREGAAHARREGCDLVIGLGGGSALDAAKAMAALAANPGDVLDYLEVIGGGAELPNAPLPMLAMPTTAGTGSEVTRNAVLLSPEHRAKVSLRSRLMIPRVALVDPELTYEMPPAVTASTGMDALTQLIEPFTCRRANPLVDALCREGMARVARGLVRAWADGSDAGARGDMSLASLLGGMALANAGLGIVHGIAGPAGGMFAAPHGALCAALLPHALAVNRRALEAREPGSPVLARYDEVARLLTGRAEARAPDGERWARDLAVRLVIPGLAAYGVTEGHIAELVEKTLAASSTRGNPIELERGEIAEIIARAL